MDSRDDRNGGADADLAVAAATARDLLVHLTRTLEDDDISRPELAALRDTRDVLARLARPAAAGTAVRADVRGPVVILDVSDLLGYFDHNRLPTGIQRVQAELIFNILEPEGGPDDGTSARLCCFAPGRNRWIDVDPAMFIDLCRLSRLGGDVQEPVWRDAVGRMRAAIDTGASLRFPQGAVLVNVGASWWLPNYFLYVRQARIDHGVRYVPLIYDLIPALTPENCGTDLVRAFVGWFLGVLDHADFYLAISDATRSDMLAVAAKLGRPIAADRIGVVRLDADFRPRQMPSAPAARQFNTRFVLFVSTLEARKNQIGALDAWATLIAKHGREKVPRLVLVGKWGFGSEQIRSRLDANADLAERVTILSGIEDAELQALYRDCLFTLYPSFYEGWGLPVTESLCYGKVPLVADNSSLPEAGGSFALYFRTGSTVDLVAMLERLILTDAVRKKQEAVIARDFRPRGWADVARDMVGKIRHWSETAPEAGWRAPVARAGAYYPLVRNHATRFAPGMGSADQFRIGLGWHDIEDWGCWTWPQGAMLRLRPSGPGVRRLGLELAFPPASDLRYRIDLVGHDISTGGTTGGPGGVRWVFLDIPEGAGHADDTGLTVRFTTTLLQPPGHGDSRMLGVGLRGFFLFETDMASRLDFLEAVALGSLCDLNVYRGP